MFDFLVLGNGFDLALNLPTRYSDFLRFAEVIEEFSNDSKNFDISKIDNFGVDSRIRDLIVMSMGNVEDNLHSRVDLLRDCCDNFWLYYFLQRRDELRRQNRENWVDFETEITKMISMVEDFTRNAEDGIDNDVDVPDMGILDDFYVEKELEHTTYRDLHNRLLRDLNNITWLLEFYLSNYVEKIEISEVDIPAEIREILFTHNNDNLIAIVDFNYTHSIDKCARALDRTFSVDYIHGEANIENHQPDGTKIVLGAESNGNDMIDFADFRKYFQRIIKGTRSQHNGWVESAKMLKEEDSRAYNHLYLFGHSLDVTDADVLRPLILGDRTYVTVFYYARDKYDHEDLASKIKNLERIIGRERLLEMTDDSVRRLEFKRIQS